MPYPCRTTERPHPPAPTRAPLLVLALFSSSVLAHTGAGEATGLLYGLLHPLSGLDHAIMMFAVGLLAWRLKGTALWALPATFVAVMALAALASLVQPSAAALAIGIALSLLASGVLLTRNKPVPLSFALPLIALCAAFHGLAHGSEMPANASGLLYGLGLVSTTAALHLAGLLTGFTLQHLVQARSQLLVRAGGVVIAATGALLLATTMPA